MERKTKPQKSPISKFIMGSLLIVVFFAFYYMPESKSYGCATSVSNSSKLTTSTSADTSLNPNLIIDSNEYENNINKLEGHLEDIGKIQSKSISECKATFSVELKSNELKKLEKDLSQYGEIVNKDVEVQSNSSTSSLESAVERDQNTLDQLEKTLASAKGDTKAQIESRIEALKKSIEAMKAQIENISKDNPDTAVSLSAVRSPFESNSQLYIIKYKVKNLLISLLALIIILIPILIIILFLSKNKKTKTPPAQPSGKLVSNNRKTSSQKINSEKIKRPEGKKPTTGGSGRIAKSDKKDFGANNKES